MAPLVGEPGARQEKMLGEHKAKMMISRDERRSAEELIYLVAGMFLCRKLDALEDIQEASQKRDAEALEIAAYSLRGSVGNFFSQGARETAQQLEPLGRSGEIAGADELVRLLEEQVGEFNRVLSRNIEGVHQGH